MPCDEIPTYEGEVAKSGFLVITMACIDIIRVGLHAKMTVSLIKKTMPRGMLEIYKYSDNNMLADLLGCMHKLVNEFHCIDDI